MRRAKELQISDFSGGLNTKTTSSNLEMNQAADLQNINLLPSGGFSSRNGNSVFNSSAMVSSSTPIAGLGYFRKSDATDALVAVASTKFFTSSSLTGTMADATGTLTITAGQNNIWTFSLMNNLIIGVGGAPDAPFTWNGAGNGAVLAGSPPNGNFGFMANNYFFIGNTTSNASRIQWSILGNPADWSGTGSGSQDVQTNDGDVLIGGIPFSLDHVLLFKQNSIHDMIVTTPPFPVFLKFSGIGAVSKRGIVNVDGITYFITPQPRMKATDGIKIIDFPDYIDDVWDSLNVSRLKYIQGVYNPVRRQIWWFVSTTSSTTNNLCLIWDLVRKCWLRHTTGYGMNCAVISKDYLPYAGAYDGKIYQLDKSSVYADASESSPGQIDSFWRTGWEDYGITGQIKYMPYFEVSYLSQVSGTLSIGYGFDFSEDRAISPLSMVATGGFWDQDLWDVGVYGGQSNLVKKVMMKGKGKFLQFLVKHKSSSEGFVFNKASFPIKSGAPQILMSS